MSNSNHRGKLCVVLSGLILSLLSVSAGAAEYMTPEYAKAEFRPKMMVLIPPRAEVIKKKVSSTEQMIEEGAVLEDATALVLKEQFDALGYQLRVLTADEVNADPELQLMVRNFNERYDADLAQVQSKPKDIRKRRFSFGDEARILAARLEADVLVVGRISASGATGGQKTMAFLLGGSSGHAALNLGIVAGDNGDLEGFFAYVNLGMSPDKIAQEPVETMAKVSAKALKKFPALNETAKYRKSWPQDTGRTVPDTVQSDADVLADLEAMMGGDTEDVAPVLEEEAGDVTPVLQEEPTVEETEKVEETEN